MNNRLYLQQHLSRQCYIINIIIIFVCPMAMLCTAALDRI